MRAVSLFSGCGGDTLGMTQAGVDVIGYCELEKLYCESHDANFKNCKCIGNDITLIKTTPNLLICTLNFNKNNIITTILYLLNSIIFKKYDVYPIDNMINTFEEIINNFDFDYNSKIIYFSAINNLNKNIFHHYIRNRYNNNTFFTNIKTYL